MRRSRRTASRRSARRRPFGPRLLRRHVGRRAHADHPGLRRRLAFGSCSLAVPKSISLTIEALRVADEEQVGRLEVTRWMTPREVRHRQHRRRLAEDVDYLAHADPAGPVEVLPEVLAEPAARTR